MFQRLLRRWFSLSRRRRPARPAIEQLEDRCLLTSGSPTAAQLLAGLPLSFEANQGQTDARVQFLAHANGYTAFLTGNDAILTLHQPGSDTAVALDMQLVGATGTAHGVGLDSQTAVSNYLLGSDPAGWHTDIATFGQVDFANVYQGIDLAYSGTEKELEYTFTVAPGADPGQIALAFHGQEGLSLDDQGNLVLHTAAGDVIHHAPVMYQEINGTRAAVSGGYVLEGNGDVGFRVGAYDPSRPLVIDPLVGGFSTYLGGSSDDSGNGIAVDAAGNTYVVGTTTSSDLPATAGAYQGSKSGISPSTAFVAKLSAAGSLVYVSYLGGSGGDTGAAIAVDAGGRAFITGATASTDFPVTAGAFQAASANPAAGIGQQAATDAYVAALNPSGTGLFYSTYLGGGGNDAGTGIAVQTDQIGADHVTVAGWTGSLNLPTAHALQSAAPFGPVLKSTSGGTTFAASSTGLTGTKPLFLVQDPATPATLYLGTLDAGLFKSTDGGATWTALNNGLSGAFPTSLGIDPNSQVSARKLYALTSIGLFYSTDGGSSWSNAGIGLINGIRNAVAVDPHTAATLYISGTEALTIGTNVVQQAGVFKSIDGGATFNFLSGGLPATFNPSTFLVVPASATATTLYLGDAGTGQLYRSTDGGATWTQAGSGLAAGAAALAYDPANPSTLYAATSLGVYKSTDGGTTFHATILTASVGTLALDPANPGTLYAGGAPSPDGTTPGRGVFKSTDGGQTWTLLTAGPQGTVPALAANAGTVLTGMLGGQSGFVAQLNMAAAGAGALTFSSYLGGNGQDAINALALDSAGNLYVTGQTTSTNLPVTTGASQATPGGGQDAFVAKLTYTSSALHEGYLTYLGGAEADGGSGIAVDGSGNAYVTGATGGAFPTTASAFQTTPTATWSAFVTKLNAAGTALVYSTLLGGNAATQGNGIAVDAAGDAYVIGTTSARNFPTVAAPQAQPAGDAIFTSGDGGTTWTKSDRGLPASSAAITLDPSTPTTLYAATPLGVFKSTDGGATWAASSTGMAAGTSVVKVLVDPHTTTTLYALAGTLSQTGGAISGGGIYKSTDGGATWTALPLGSATALAISPTNSSTLYAGTVIGVFKSTNGGSTWTLSSSGLSDAVQALTVDPNNTQVLYAGSASAGYRSADGGATWTRLTSLGTTTIEAFAVTPGNSSVVYAAIYGRGVWKSTDGGISFLPTNLGLGNLLVTNLTIDPTAPATIYAATVPAFNAAGQIYKTTTSGASWSVLAAGPQGNILNIAVNPAAHATLYVGVGVPAGDAFVAKLTPKGTGLIYSTYLGGSGADGGNAIAVDAVGHAYVTGSTGSTDFLTSGTPAQATDAGGKDAFVTQLTTPVVTPGVLAGFTITTIASAIVGGTAFPVTITAVDGNLDPLTGYSGTATLASSDTGLHTGDLPTLHFSQGVATANVILRTSGSQTLTVTDSASGKSTSVTLAVQANPTANVSSFRVASTAGSATAGSGYTLTVSALDAGQNVSTGYRGTIRFTLPATAFLQDAATGQVLSGSSYTFTAADNGTHSFAVTFLLAGTTTVGVADSVNASVAGTLNVVVNAAAASELAFLQQPANGSVGAALQPAVTVAVEDVFGNVVTTSNASVSLGLNNAGGATLGGTTTVQAVNGLATFGNLTISKTGTNFTLTASSTGLTGATSTSFAVAAGSAASLTLTPSVTSAVAGSAFTLTVNALDAQQNVAAGYRGTVTFTLPANATIKDAASGQVLANNTWTFTGADAGTHAFTVTLLTAGSATLAVSDSSNASLQAGDTLSVTPAAASKLAFLQQPTNAISGVALQPAVTVGVEDPYGNVVSTSAATISVVLTTPAGATLSGTTSVQANGGIATFANLSVDKVNPTDTLTATANGLTGATSAPFAVAPAAAATLSLATSASTLTAGTGLTLTLTAQDAQQNSAAGYRGTVTFTLPANATLTDAATGQVLAGNSYTFTAADNGTHSFTATLRSAGNASVSVADAGNAALGASAQLTVNSAAASQLIFTQQPATTTAGAILRTTTVQELDAFGNRVSSGSATVALALNSSNSATLHGTTSVQASGGVATFTNLAINQSGTNYTLTASAAGLTSATSSTFAITPGTATTLTLTPSVSTVTAGTPFTLTVTALDAQQNTATGYRGTTTFTLPANATLKDAATGQALAGNAYNFTASDAGTHSFTVTLLTAGSTSLAVSDANTPPLTSSQTLAVNPAAASQLVFVQQPSNSTAGTVLQPAVRVAVEDAYGNVVNTSAAVSLALTNAGGATLSGTTTVSASGGVASFANLSVNRAGSGYSLSATATGLPASTSAPFAVSAGSAASLALSASTSSPTAGQGVTLTATALDAQQNTATGYTGTVVFTLPANATLNDATTGTTLAGNRYTFTAADQGTHRFTVTLRTAGSATVSLTDAGQAVIQGSTTLTVIPAAASQLVFVQQPANVNAGATLPPVTVAIEDAFGNRVTSTAAVSLALVNAAGATLSGTTTVAANSGLATFSTLSVAQAGTGYALAASANGLSNGTSSSFAVTAASASSLTLTPAASNITAGAPLTLTVRALDAQQNTAVNYLGTIAFSVPANAIVSDAATGQALTGNRYSFTAADQGTHTFALTLKTAGSVALGVTDTAGSSLTANTTVTVTPATAQALAFVQQPANGTAGTALGPVTVQVLDAFGNRATASPATITLALNSGTLTGITSVQTGGGVATFTNLAINQSGTNYTLTASSAGLTSATSSVFAVAPGNAATLALTPSLSMATAGTPFTLTVTALDAQQNTATGYRGTVTFTLPANAVLRDAATGQTLSGNTYTFTAGDGGTHRFAVTLFTAGGTTLAVGDGSNPTLAVNQSLTVSPAAASQLVFVQQPMNSLAGATLPPVTVAVEDAFGNRVTSTAAVSLALVNAAGATLSGTTTVAASGGLATFSNLSIAQAGTGYALAASANGLSNGTSSSFAVTAASASSLTLTPAASSITAGAPLTLTVQAFDAQQNTAVNYLGTIAFSVPANATVSDAATGQALSGNHYTFTAADQGTHTFTLTLKTAGSVALGVTDTAGSSLTASTTVTVNPSAGQAIAFVQQPANGTAGATLGPVTVQVLDAFGNRATASPATITLALNSGTLTGITSVQTGGGVATFTNLAINQSGTSYTLTASAAGLIAATSSTFAITSGTAATLTLTPSVSTVTAGTPFTLTVTALDAQQNTATGYRGTTTFTLPANATLKDAATGQALAGNSYTFTTGDAGTHSFSITLLTTGSAAIAISDANTPSLAASQIVAVRPAAASQLVFVQQPATTTAGTVLQPAVRVAVEDTYGNVVNTSASVSLALTNAGGATLNGTTALSASGGVASFTNLSVNRSGSGYTLSATSTGLPASTSAPFAISAGTAASLALTAATSSATAGQGVTLIATALDAQQNTATSYTGTVTFTLPANATLIDAATGTALAGNRYTFTAADQGTHRFTVTPRTAGNAAVSLADTNQTAIQGSTTLTVSAATASQLVFVQQPANVNAGATLPPVTVLVEDAFGNQVNSTATVSLALVNGSGAILSGTTSAQATGGVATFGNLSIAQAGTGYALAASAGDSSGATSTSFAVTAASAASLSLTPTMSSTTAGAPLTLTVRALDAEQNTAVSYLGTVTLHVPANATLTDAATGQALSGGRYTFTAADRGIHTFAVTLKTAGSVALGVTDGTMNSLTASTTVTITPATAQALAFVQQPASGTVGTTLSPVTVQVLDAFGNRVTASPVAVTLALNSGNLTGTTSVQTNSGVATFGNLAINQGGPSYTLTASAAGLTAATSSAFAITSGTATALTLTPSATTATAGSAFALTVKALDAQQNLAAGYRGTVMFALPFNATLVDAATGQAVVGSSYTFTAADGGTHSFTVTLPRSGSVKLAVFDLSAPSLVGLTAMTVSPAAASQLVFVQQPQGGSAGVALQPAVSVALEDAFGNLVATSNATVALSLTGTPGATLSGTTAVQARTGLATFTNLSLDRAGTGYTLTASSDGLTAATSAPFSVAAGSATTLSLVPSSTTLTAGNSVTFTLTARDAQQNVATGYTGTVTFALPGQGTLSDAATGVSLPGNRYTFTASDQGTHTFRLTLSTAGTGSFTVADTATPALTASTTLSVNPAAASQLVFVQQPLGGMTGTPFGTVVVAVEDAFGNRVTTPATVTLTLNGGGSLAGTTSATTSGGLAAFSNLVVNQSGTTWTLTASVGGMTAVSAPFAIADDTTGKPFTGTSSATQLTLDVPAAVAAGTYFTVTITARDASGNVAADYRGTVQLGTSGPDTLGLPATYTFTAAENGQHTFTLVPQTAGTLSITATDSVAGLQGVSSPLTVLAAGSNTATVASPAAPSDAVTFTTDAGTTITSVNTPALAPPPGADLAMGDYGLTLQGNTPGFRTTVTVTLPPGSHPTGYYLYGPTTDNPTPHWYNFTFDGISGARISGNVITLTFMDGQRGDDDLTANGVIVDPGAPSFSPMPGVTTANQRLVAADYLALLGRPVDAAGLAYWSGMLDAGQGPATVALGIQASTEYQICSLQNSYSTYLGRPADAQGLTYWLQLLAGGGTLEQVRDRILGSAEYYLRAGGTDAAFVSALYHNLLGRPANATEAVTWGDRLTSSSSPPSRGLIFSQMGTDPASVLSRDTLAEMVGSTPEGQQALVQSLYALTLGRTADAAGLAFWSQALAGGMASDQLLAELLASGEFAKRM